MCKHCLQWENEGTICLLFPSEADFKNSKYYNGEDNVKGDPIAKKAVWIGKNNIGRKNKDWWICTPVHPNCSHSWQSYDPDFQLDEDIKDFGIDLLAEQAEQNKRYRERNKSEYAIELNYIEETCSCETDISIEEWVSNYLKPTV